MSRETKRKTKSKDQLDTITILKISTSQEKKLQNCKV